MQHGYKRLTKNEYLHADIEKIKQAHHDFLVREAMPKANKVVMKKLKAEEFPAVKLVYDKYYGQEQPQAGTNIFINKLNQLVPTKIYGQKEVESGEEEVKKGDI